MRKLTIQAMWQLAERRGGKCLSGVYVNSQSRLLWQCAQGHKWEATPGNIKQGHWCPYCAGWGKTIQDMQQLAAQHGGKCLSDIYVNARSKLLWQCAKGHRWKATPNNAQRGHWCLICAGKGVLTIEEMHRLAEARGGKCLSDSYVNSKTPLLWVCRAGHRWKAAPGNVKGGKWCSVCAGISKPSMGDIRRLANERGGKCLSHNYRNSKTLLSWECMEGHQWKASWTAIRHQGQWCPTCSTGLGERICREFFSQLFHHPFPKARPKWLLNKAGNQMELDGYCASLGIAFEHQGEQHYSTEGYFIDSELNLARRQEDDALKSELCAQRGITLISVPEIPNRLPLDQVKKFIKERVAAKGIPLPPDFDTRDVDVNKSYRTPGSREILNHLRRIATEHRGQCLSTTYVNDGTKLLWQCARGHKWQAAPSYIKQGSWCPFCAGTVTKTLEEMQAIAVSRGGKCLSPIYEGNHKRLVWACSQGHRWQATPAHIQQGEWCPKCAGNVRKTIEDMKAIAESRGGRCLSPIYKGAHTRLVWRCHAGHTWEAVPSSVQSRTWCPYCAGNVRKTIEDMRGLATQHGGQCLSDEYVNSSTHLLWQCKEGHQWEAVPDSIKGGHWCPDCYNERRGRRPRQAP